MSEDSSSLRDTKRKRFPENVELAQGVKTPDDGDAPLKKMASIENVLESDAGYTEDCDGHTEASDELAIDFVRDIHAETASEIGEFKNESQDRFITLEPIAIDIVTNSDALCYITGVFDGHCGHFCADYVLNHIKNNILSVFRQHIRVLHAKRQAPNYKSKSDDDPCLEVATLLHACRKAFEMVDKNFLNIAKKNGLYDGTTACIALLYGPDTDGSLRIITANVGDSRALLATKSDDGLIAKPLTYSHKPDEESEKNRIIKAGGSVKYLQGAWRAVLENKRGQFALATSRSFGDLALKEPHAIVSCQPHIAVYTVDFDNDLFLILCTDGVSDFIKDQIIIDEIYRQLKQKQEPKAAAEYVIRLAQEEGSQDDRTLTVIQFGWNKVADLDDSCDNLDQSNPSDLNDNLDNEEDMFS
ncbi:bifunctional PPM-type phosphatase domain/PPM-type phosphatase domain superfamily [Babesia duncani]|uniref:Bifunctional PPM-type phosphatase domain/PPM-type phosphatase domain superfamily n=1 Tax=Babesia duncani TaxID=323732 RepID=A0AAD9PN89_9APIC|nr:bifunctional PPM-type phosphatase domain/PPM-type phosphatase domain superfamily [Babesia duncani]